jgi:hypothetical protein
LIEEVILKKGEKGKGNKFFILIIVGIIILIVGLILFFVFKSDDLCSGIKNEYVLEECKSCYEAHDPIDCLDEVYSDAALLNQDVSLCENIVYDYIKGTCISHANDSRGNINKEVAPKN